VSKDPEANRIARKKYEDKRKAEDPVAWRRYRQDQQNRRRSKNPGAHNKEQREWAAKRRVEDPEYFNKYTRERKATNRSDWFAENGPCVTCGSWEALELDHIDPAEKVTHNIWNWSAERIAEETAKCQVLCTGCHKKKTAADRRAARPAHGQTEYTYHKCRCDLCREIMRLYHKEYYLRKKEEATTAERDER